MVEVMIQRIAEVDMPRYAHDGDAGMDLFSAEERIIEPAQTAIIRTGIKVSIPKGYAGLVWDRSGLAAKHSLHALAGVIDSGYRGEIGIVLKNLSNEKFLVERNMRIAQLLIQPVETARIVETDSLDATSRNQGGFGSTGR